jgi:hypothetical protein
MNLKLIYAFLRFGCLPCGLILLGVGIWTPPAINNTDVTGAIARVVALGVGLLLVLLGAFVLGNIYFSRNSASLNPVLDIETWAVTDDRMHNSNTDLIWFRDSFHLAYAVSPYHFGSAKCKLVVKRSTDGIRWTQVTEIKYGQQDIRDPKFAVINGILHLYCLLNHATQPLPYTTRMAWSEDGTNWSDLVSIGHEGWLFWRPKTSDGKTWYVPAYWHQFHHNALFATTNGKDFRWVATIRKGQFINEPEIEFLSDGSLLATGRADYNKNNFDQVIGIPKSSTFLSLAEPPYTRWQDTAEDQLTRLDGPVMFRYRQHIYAVGRAHPYHGARFPRRCAVLGKKRTAIFEVHPEGLIHISDLPSSGDTSYAGVVLRDGFAYISYYTSKIQRDPIWLFGMLDPSEIRLAKIDLEKLERVVEKAGITPSQEENSK